MEVEGGNPPRIARERAVITHMVRYLEISERNQVDISGLEHLLLGTEIARCKHARRGCYSRFVLLETLRGGKGGRGAEVAGAVL